MQTTKTTSETRVREKEIRKVPLFERVWLRVQNMETYLTIQQGNQEAVVVEAEKDVLQRIITEVQDGQLYIKLNGSWSDFVKEALNTSFTRRRIDVKLTLPKLSALNIDGIFNVQAEGLITDSLVLMFRGPGVAEFSALQARILEVDIAGPCKIEAMGKVIEQRLTVHGMSYYAARGLESARCIARIDGPAQATVRVCDELDATLSSPGRLEYYGTPRVKRRGNFLGLLVHLDK